MYFRHYFLILICIIQTACATNAQMQFNQYNKLINEAKSNLDNCMQNASNASHSQKIFQKVMVWDSNPPNKLELLSSSEKLSNDLKNDFISTVNDLNLCRGNFAKELSIFNSEFSQIVTNSQNKIDEINVELLQKKITIGEFNRKYSIIKEHTNMEGDRAYKNLTSELENRHYQEVNNRQRSSQQAYDNYLRQEILRQQQEAINQQSLRNSQPINTNCYRSGNYVNCTTR